MERKFIREDPTEPIHRTTTGCHACAWLQTGQEDADCTVLEEPTDVVRFAQHFPYVREYEGRHGVVHRDRGSVLSGYGTEE